MKGVGGLKDKILKVNFFSVLTLIIMFSVLSFAIVYFIIEASLKKEIEFIQNDYLYSRKEIVKNEVYKFKNYIRQIGKIESEKYLNKLKNSITFLSSILHKESPSNFKYVLKEFEQKHPFFIIVLSDVKGKKIYANTGECSKNERNRLIKRLLSPKLKNSVFFTLKTQRGILFAGSRVFTNIFNGEKYIITSAVYKNTIDRNVRSAVVNLLKTVNSLFSSTRVTIIKISEKKKGEWKFVINALDEKSDGNVLENKKNFSFLKKYVDEIRKNFNEDEKFFIYKYKNRTYVAFVSYYRPYGWIILDSLDISKIDEIINNRKELIRKEIVNIFAMYFLISLLFLIIVFFITRYENRILSVIIDKYDTRIRFKNKTLKILNKNLQKEINKKTKELVKNFFTDPLTGLPNREKLLADLEKHKYIAIINIDSFKEINDFYGLEIGDEVLKTVAETIKKNTSPYKLPADEFAVLGESLDELEQKVENIIKKVENHKIKTDSDIELDITLSAGIGENLTQADTALKFAKNSKNIIHKKIIVYSDSLPLVKEYHNNIKWKNILKHVIEKDLIIPHVQPIVNALNGKTEKYECLIRIEYDGKIYSPYFFLDISRKTGQYIKLQKAMIDKCFAVFKDLDCRFSINLSAFELDNVQFREYLISKIDEYHVADRLIIELLEDEKLHNEELMGFLIFLHNLDVEFAIDDFGSGHSNLSYLLSKLPVSILKIDGSLIKNINENKNNYKLVKALVNMAKIFKLSVIAEFVENEQISQILKGLGVDYLQGYYYSKPFPLDKLKKWI